MNRNRTSTPLTAPHPTKKILQDPPKWFDSNGVPRYEQPHPSFCPNIYADAVLFYEIACQQCDRRFIVETFWDSRWKSTSPPPPIYDISNRAVHYGDPPAHDCGGDTMNSIPLCVVQFWQRNSIDGWHHVSKFDGVNLRPAWADETTEKP